MLEEKNLEFHFLCLESLDEASFSSDSSNVSFVSCSGMLVVIVLLLIAIIVIAAWPV